MSSKRARGVGGMIVVMLFGLGLAEGGGCSSSSSPAGAEGQACYPNDSCNTGLTCASHKCVKLPGGTAGTSGAAGSTSAAGTMGSGGAAGTTSTGGAGGSAGASAGAGGAAAGGGGSSAGAGGSSAGAGGGAAGAGGGAAGAGGASAGGGGSSAGAGGSSAGAGGGAAGAGGGTSCDVTATYGPVTFAAAAQGSLGYTNGTTLDEVDWDAALNNDVKPDVLDFGLINRDAPFTTGISAMNAIDLAGQDDFQSCGACVLIIAHADTTNPVLLKAGDNYIATSGTMNLTAVPTTWPIPAGSRITGTFTNVVFKHVKIDPVSGATSKIDDCKITLTSASFDSVVKPGQ